MDRLTKKIEQRIKGHLSEGEQVLIAIRVHLTQTSELAPPADYYAKRSLASIIRGLWRLYIALSTGLYMPGAEYVKKSPRVPIFVLTNKRGFVCWYTPNSLEINEISEQLSKTQIKELLTNGNVHVNTSTYFVSPFSKKKIKLARDFINNLA